MAKVSMKFFRFLIGGVIVAGLPASASPVPTAPQTRACPAGDRTPAISLTVSGLKRNSGIVNVFVFGGQPQDWLSKDRRVARLWYRAPTSGDLQLCIPVPANGRYGVAVHHDMNGDLKRDANDGIGYSRNPALTVFRLKPSYAQAAFTVDGASPVAIVLQYRSGLSIGPAKRDKH